MSSLHSPPPHSRPRWVGWGRKPPPLPPSRTNWTRLVPPSVLIGHVSSSGLQSSTSAGGEAARANDGDRSGVFAEGSCTHTWDDAAQSGVGTADPWWEVDLGRSRAVAAAVLHNRADCCGERLSGVTVRVGDSPAPGHGENAVCAREVSVPQGGSLVAVCENGALHGR